MDPDVVEIPPPIHHGSKYYHQNKASSFHRFKAIFYDVIDIDNDDDSEDVVIIGEKVNNSNKGKTIDAVHDDHQVVEMSDYTFSMPGVEHLGSVSGIASSNGFPSMSNNVINVDGLGSDLSYDDDDYIDTLSEDYMDVDEYALLQKHFDNVDIPPGIEAPFNWLPPGYDLGLKKTGNSTLYPWHHMQSDANKSPIMPSSQPSLSLELTNSKIEGSSVGSSNIQIKMDNVDHSSGMELSSPPLFSEPSPFKKKSATSIIKGRLLNASFGVVPSQSHWFSGPSHSDNIMKHTTAYEEVIMLPQAGEPPYWGQFESAEMDAGSSISPHSNFMGPHGLLHPHGIESGKPWWKSSHNAKPLFTHHNANHHIYYPFDPLHAPPEHVFHKSWVPDSARDEFNGTAVHGPIVTISDEARNELLRKFQSFKQFDTVEDTSDHYFIRNNSSMKQPPKNWAKKIQEEWKILQKDLPDSIFVRVYESRMDLLRAAIIGAEGTPYHDGLFFFDVFFPSGYPHVPPSNTRGIFSCSKSTTTLEVFGSTRICIIVEKYALVCLTPGLATKMRSGFQVLVSIQGLILNTKPYFNEPGFAHTSGSVNGEKMSSQYNEDTFILSLRTMVYMIRRPPKNFEDFVKGHFCSRAGDILVACKAYIEGAQVGCLVKGGVQDVDEGDKSCSKRFQESLSGYMNMLVREFSQIGAQDIEKFLPPPTTLEVNKPSGVSIA
ncbi:putative ubiquitin-conjugating enzyme E2 26, partial [Mucuna pruriens]